MSHTGDTSTSQMSQHALALRFLLRTQAEVAQLRACLPDEPLPIELAAIAHVERMAHRISSGAEAFGFPEIDAIAGAIELMTQDIAGRTVRQRIELAIQLAEKVSALSVYVEYEMAEKEAKRVPAELPLSAHLPGFGVRRK
ncbi:MAG TPA: Hpt domain-containing protein [Steroidobacteraceae bacterium]|nr:Hpt domain-containing protein [Steroidobacteraceae bacterium]